MVQFLDQIVKQHEICVLADRCLNHIMAVIVIKILFLFFIYESRTRYLNLLILFSVSDNSDESSSPVKSKEIVNGNGIRKSARSLDNNKRNSLPLTSSLVNGNFKIISLLISLQCANKVIVYLTRYCLNGLKNYIF